MSRRRLRRWHTGLVRADATPLRTPDPLGANGACPLPCFERDDAEWSQVDGKTARSPSA